MPVTESHNQTKFNTLLISKNQLGFEETYDEKNPEVDESDIEEGSGDILEEWDMHLSRVKRDYKTHQILDENMKNEDMTYMLVPIARVRIVSTHWVILKSMSTLNHDLKYVNFGLLLKVR